MDDLNDPNLGVQAAAAAAPANPAGYRRKLSKAQRKQKALAEARASRWHLVGLTDAAVIIVALAAAAMVVMVAVLVLISHR